MEVSFYDGKKVVFFLYLYKYYYALNRGRYMSTLEGFWMLQWDCRLLYTYWCQLTMVDRAGGYCGAPFKGFRGVTQGCLLSYTIFNVVVDTVVRHYISLVM